MSLIPDKVQEQRSERPLIGSLLLLVTGMMTVYGGFMMADSVPALIFDVVLAHMFVGVALVGAGVVVYVRPDLSKMVGVGIVLYVILALVFPYSFFGTSLPGPFWTLVGVIGGLLCIAWASKETSPELAENKPTT